MEPDSPEKKAKLQAQAARYNQLNHEDRAVAQQIAQERIHRAEQLRAEEHQKKQQEEALKAQSVVVPTGPQRGGAGPGGSQKPHAVQKLEDNRKKMQGGPQDVG